MKSFKYIERKSARNLLIGLDIAQNVITLDQQTIKILKKLGTRFPKEFIRKDNLYCEVKKELISKIYKLLGLSGAQFNHMLYQNCDKIHEFMKGILKTSLNTFHERPQPQVASRNPLHPQPIIVFQKQNLTHYG
jgi:hypothetical protein